MTRPGRLLRSIAAVVIGYLIFALSAVMLFQIARRNPHAPQPLGFMLLATLYGMAFAALGGFVAGRIAADRPRLHAALVAGLIALGAAVSIVTSPGDSTWSQWSALILMAPCAYLGGRTLTK